MSIADKLAAERRGRLAAERLLELKQAELYAANRKLGLHARALSEEIVETRAQYQNIQSEHQKVKSDLSVTTQNLEIAERRLWMSISTIQDGFAFFDTDDNLIAANGAYMSAFDGLEEIRPGVAYARILQLLTEEGIVDTGDMSGSDWRANILRHRQQNLSDPITIRLWNDQYIKLVEHRGAGGDVVSLGLNITSTVIYEKELKDARYKAEAAARAKSAFLANMSHEIRTPMNGVVGMAELLQDSPLDDEQQLYTDTIKNSGEALMVIINDILDYSKIDAEKLVLQKSPFDLEKSIHEVMMLLHSAAREKDVSLLIDYDLFLARDFIGDAGRIRQILTNLIGNAVKFTLEGHVLVRITGIADDDDKICNLHVAIEDTGIGIPSEKVDHIFGEFTQVDDERNREFEGTGLGLAISKRLVELMGGEIWVTSEQHLGSCFGFRIPLECSDSSISDVPRLPATLNRVMLVDDTETNLDILKRQLLAMGVAADGFASGEAALDALDGTFDLIISDHVMPGLSGPEFLSEARNRGFNIPAIILSSNPSGLGAATQSAQISAVLQRPVLRDRLVATLTDLGVNPGNKTEPETTKTAGTDHVDEVTETNSAEDSPKEPPLAVFRRRQQPEPDNPVEIFKSNSELDVSEQISEYQGAPQPGQIVESEEKQLGEDLRTEDSSPPEGVPEVQPKNDPIPVENSQVGSTEQPSVTLETESTLGPDLEPEFRDPAPEQIQALESAASDVQTVPDPPSETITGQRQMRIMTAEDNKTNQLVLSKMLKKLDIDLKFANDGEQAVSTYQEFQPDLIFMDISMPRMDGKEATAAIRMIEDETDKMTPIVALTAHAMTGDDQSILAAGLDDYLTKPFKKPAIIAVIAKHAPAEVRPPIPKDAPEQGLHVG